MAAEVHVWRIPLECGDAALDRLRTFLADDERQRAERFYFEKDRRHFIAGRGALRSLVAGYLNRHPSQVRLAYTNYGKPLLAAEFGSTELRFNLSHSHGLALLAVTRGRDIGVDLEHIRANLDGEQLAERFFSPCEVAVLRSLAPELRREAFFQCWTRKEAYIKANGKGLSLPLDQFDVTLRPGEPAALMATHYDPAEAGAGPCTVSFRTRVSSGCWPSRGLAAGCGADTGRPMKKAGSGGLCGTLAACPT